MPGEGENAVMVVHGEKAHSRYFGETAFSKPKGDNKELVIVPGANIDENDGVRHAAVQDGFIRIAIPAGLQSGKNTVTLVAIDPGVVIDRIGVK